jgi:hypothetical protein
MRLRIRYKKKQIENLIEEFLMADALFTEKQVFSHMSSVGNSV